MPKFPIPNADVAEAMIPKVHGIATNFRDMSDQLLAGSRTAGRRPCSRSTTPSPDRPLAGAAARGGPAPPHRRTDRRRRRGRLADAAARRDRWRRATGDGRLPRHDPGSGPAARPRRRSRRAQLARRRRRRLRPADPVPHDARADRPARSTRSGSSRSRSSPTSTASSGREVLGTDDVPEIFRRLRDDPALHHTNGPDIVAASKTALAKATAAMGDWFGILPKADCDVEETQSGAIAFYFPPAKDGSRGGVFFMNTSDPHRLGPLPDRGDLVPRGDPGAPPPARDLDRADRRPGVPQARLHRRLRRGLGPLQRAARGRDGPLLHAAGPDGDARGRLDAGLPARRRHRDARPRLEPAARRSTT